MKKITATLFVMVVCLPELLFSQVFQWAAHGGGASGDYGNSIAIDAQGNTYVTGWYQNTATFGSLQLTSAGGYDMYLVKYDNNGQVVWARSAGGSGVDIGYGVDLDANGNIYVAGTFEATATFGSITVSSMNSSEDIFVARYDANGNALWVQQAGSTTDDQAQAIYVDQASAKIYITGYFKSTAAFGSLSVSSSGQSDVFVAKYDTIASINSTPLWVHKGGGAGYDISYGVCTDAAGNVFITGVFTGTANFDGMNATSAGGDDIYVAKYNSAGVIQWVHRDGGPQWDVGTAIASSGTDVYYTGWFAGSASFGTINLTGAGVDEIFIAKLNVSGNVVWAERAGGIRYDQGYGICTDAAGNVYVTGAYDSVATFGATTLISAGSWDVFAAKYSSAGIFQWVLSGGSPASSTFERDIGYSIAADAAQNLYICGIIENTASFGTFSLPSNGIQDMFAAKISVLTGTENPSGENNIIFYPNPAGSQLSFTGYFISENIKVEIFDIHGNTVLSRELPGNNKGIPAINIADFVPGIYFVRIREKGNFMTGKFIKE